MESMTIRPSMVFNADLILERKKDGSPCRLPSQTIKTDRQVQTGFYLSLRVAIPKSGESFPKQSDK